MYDGSIIPRPSRYIPFSYSDSDSSEDNSVPDSRCRKEAHAMIVSDDVDSGVEHLLVAGDVITSGLADGGP